MNTFRTSSADNFPYMEGILNERMQVLTLLFSGSNVQDNIAFNFTLVVSSDILPEKSVDTLIGYYLSR